MTTRSAVSYRIARLLPRDGAVAKALFAMMSEVFEEEHHQLSDDYIEKILAREDTWVIAAMSGDDLVGGVTAHVLPMTRSESKELFIYDVAVRADHQRRGVGRQMLEFLRKTARDGGIADVFVAADDEDRHAVDFYRALGGVGAPVTIFTFE